MKKLRVLQINKLYHPAIGGVEQVVRQVSEGLNNKVDMKVLVCRDKGATVNDMVDGVKVCRAGSLGVYFSMPVSFSFFTHFARLIKDRDILHIHMPFPLADMAAAFCKFDGKIILWWHSDIRRQKKFGFLYKPFLTRLLNRADAIIVATQGHIDGSEYLGDYRAKCHIIPFGLGPRFIGRADAFIDKRDRGLILCENDNIRFLFVGRLIYYKGLDVLIRAFASMKHLDKSELHIVGDGSLFDELAALIKELGLDGRVSLYGKLDDDKVLEQFKKADVFVLPSVVETEAFGLVQLEAMAYGLPVINTKLKSGVPYVSLDGESGITVPPGDSEALAEAMDKLVMDEDLRKTLGHGAYARVRNEFSEKKMLDRILHLYSSVCNNES